MNRRQILSFVGAAGCGAIVAAAVLPGWGTKLQPENVIMQDTQSKLLDPIPQSEVEWKSILTPEQFRILRRKGTERAFTGEYSSSKKHGVYRCAGCGQTLFSSDHKFDSGTGWPSFWQPIEDSHVATEADNGFFTSRTEVLCNRCRGHLGHVFNDGPRPTGLRYCINSVALKLDETS